MFRPLTNVSLTPSLLISGYYLWRPFNNFLSPFKTIDLWLSGTLKNECLIVAISTIVKFDTINDMLKVFFNLSFNTEFHSINI